ncbi:MAG: hypothetical protein WC071_08435, partial [Victivallaceae bacterium]
LPLRNFAKNLEDKFEKISIDLKDCTAMDSTFMGILAMIGLKAKAAKATVDIVNASESNHYLLKGLGLEKLFNFVEQETPGSGKFEQWRKEENAHHNQLEAAETVTEAHKTLVNVDAMNIPKFEKVIEFAEADVERLKKKNSDSK